MVTWKDRLLIAKALGTFSDDDRWTVGDWKSCKVGERAWRMPDPDNGRTALGMLLDDEEIYNLGMEFMQAVRHDRVKEAESLAEQLDALIDRKEVI